jgi:endonuclease/exonuclease/phosphatase family metal-dependent hydrolase
MLTTEHDRTRESPPRRRGIEASPSLALRACMGRVGERPRPGTRGLRWALAAAAALAGAAWLGAQPRPLGPAEGTALEGQDHVASAHAFQQKQDRASGPQRKTLRVGTFNIHGCRGADGRRDLDRVARCLADLDFAALNEVHGPHPWQQLDQAAELAARLDMAWLFAPNTRTWCCLESGNGLLSAWPASFWRRIPLAHRRERGYRNAVLVGLEHGARTVSLLLTHITRSDDASRAEQLRAVAEMYLALAEPAVLLGDLNTPADDPEMRRLLAAPGVRDPLGEKLGAAAPPRIDWILARGMRPVDAGLREQGASDHPLVWAELE